MGRGHSHASEHIAYNFDPTSDTLDADYDAFRKIAKKLPEAERKAIQVKFDAAHEQQHAEARRKVNTHFYFWLVCTNKACRRTSRCMGEAEPCFRRWWPVVPARQKRFFQFCLEASRDGTSPAEAVRIALAKCEQFADAIAEEDERQLAELRAREKAEKSKKDESVGNAPHPVASGHHPLPAGGEREKPGPRVRAL